VLKLANGQGGAGAGTTSGTQGAHNNALTQQKGSGIVDVYVDKQNQTTSQSTKLDGGAGGIVINQGKGGGQPQTIQASVPIASMPAGAKPQARTADGKALPAWLKFDAATGKFEGKPPADFKGELKVNVSVPQADGTTRTVPMRFTGKQ
jgi:filamentous hemagglutinin